MSISQRIIVPEMLGRLGNNLFQVGAAMHCSKVNGLQWAIPPHYHHRQIYKYFKFPVYRGNVKKLPVYDTATDEGFTYRDFPKFTDSVKIRGFWQSYKYLDPVKDQFISALNFKNYPDLHDFTSIHIRRTDYVTHADYFGPVSIDYVKKAIDRIADLTGKRPDKFIVFSDDPSWCKQTFPEYLPHDIFVYSEGKNEYEELSKMASCKKNIIANSSFSYIAAYCNTSPDKIVISPSAKDWFGPKSKLDTKDLLPLDWNQINFR